MIDSPFDFRTLLTHDDWTPVTDGESGAFVFRSGDGTRYAKCVPAAELTALEAERDRVDWLGKQDVPGPRVLDWHADDHGAALTTSTVEGVPADQLPTPQLFTAWEAITDAVRELHSLPAKECPFSRDLTQMYALAGDVVARGAVTADFLPVDQQQTPADELLARLTPQLDQRLAQEAQDTVVCHGDLCLPNIILDPETLTVAGFIDLGRLGRADRYADLALLLASARLEKWTDTQQADAAEQAFAARYDTTLDRDRERFYLHLDPLTWG